jgi:hypothetical protein
MYATSKGDLEAMRVLMDAGAALDTFDIVSLLLPSTCAGTELSALCRGIII